MCIIFNVLVGTQEHLDRLDKAEISVRSKAPELIGRMTVSMWLYCNGKLYHCTFKPIY